VNVARINGDVFNLNSAMAVVLGSVYQREPRVGASSILSDPDGNFYIYGVLVIHE
jgi:hypothetical protein